MYGAWRWINLRNYFAALYYVPEHTNIAVEKIPSLKEKLDLDVFVRENGININI